MKTINETELLKKVISAGDLVDKLLINELKINRFKEEEKKQALALENEDILKVLEVLRSNSQTPFDGGLFMVQLKELKNVLEKQWDILEVVYENTGEQSQKAAVKAQLLNDDRVFYKNKINRLFGTNIEFKNYATQKESRLC
jgi:hypothetical protein